MYIHTYVHIYVYTYIHICIADRVRFIDVCMQRTYISAYTKVFYRNMSLRCIWPTQVGMDLCMGEYVILISLVTAWLRVMCLHFVLF